MSSSALQETLLFCHSGEEWVAELIDQLSVWAVRFHEIVCPSQNHNPQLLLPELPWTHDQIFLCSVKAFDLIASVSPEKLNPSQVIVLFDSRSVEEVTPLLNEIQPKKILFFPWTPQQLHETLLPSKEAGAAASSEYFECRDLRAELKNLTSDLEKRVAERTHDLAKALQQLEARNQILERIALTDPLTKIPNRRAIELIARKELLRRQREPSAFALIMIDADRFKTINSDYSLTGGDHVLATIAEKLQQTIRVTDSIGRIGGEEFMVVAPLTNLEGARTLCERLRLAIQDHPFRYHDKLIPVTISLGVAVVEEQQEMTFDTLRALAADALTEAKESGRNRSIIRINVTDQDSLNISENISIPGA